MSDNAGWAASVSDQLRRRSAAAAEQLGPEIVADVRQAASVPVEKEGGRIVRSKAGEPPRKQTGALVESIGYEVTAEALVVFSTCAYAARLETDGDRPLFGPAFERWADPAAERLGAA